MNKISESKISESKISESKISEGQTNKNKIAVFMLWYNYPVQCTEDTKVIPCSSREILQTVDLGST